MMEQAVCRRNDPELAVSINEALATTVGGTPGAGARRARWSEPDHLWVTFRMSRAEFVATMKYTLDLRLQGNRAPLVFSAHSDYYASKWTPAIPSTLADRQAALTELIDYAASQPAVRITTARAALDWIRNPSPL